MNYKEEVISFCYSVVAVVNLYAVEELEKKKYDLLQQSSITTVAQKIVAKNQDGTHDTLPSSALCTPQEVVQDTEERKLEAFLQAYRLAGTSIIKFENGVLLIELLTSYGGVYV